ncbi:hypothetical protein [Salinigranum rubrum]|uniref:hypothetical protein n=1 Tax=Salinigranum rubrum TaxID=755307 RepID=UPI0013A52D74|nr:hypothetical protein [Salinigranum rubrum]
MTNSRERHDRRGSLSAGPRVKSTASSRDRTLQYRRLEATPGVDRFERRDIGPVTAFLQRLTERDDLSDTDPLVDSDDDPTARIRVDEVGCLDDVGRNRVVQWLRTLETRVDRVDHPEVGSRVLVTLGLAHLSYYYDVQRPHRALDERTPPTVGPDGRVLASPSYELLTRIGAVRRGSIA